jgi:hypothetical protein
MRVDGLLLCRGYTMVGGLLDLIEGPATDTFTADELPVEIALNLVVGSIGRETGDHVIRVQILDDQLATVVDLGQTVGFGSLPSGLPSGWDARHLNAFTVPLTFEQAGTYMVTVSIEGGESMSHAFFVNKR